MTNNDTNNQQLARRRPTEMAVLPEDPEQRNQLLRDRLSELPLSQQTNSVVTARLTGTPLRTASLEQLSSMWNQVIILLRIQFKTDSEESQFWAELLDLNDWLRRQYGPKGITCEEVQLAYNHLVMEELHKDNGKVLEAYPFLTPKHIGEVLAAYKRFVDADPMVNRVIEGRLFLPPPAEPTAEEIDAWMEHNLQQAIGVTRIGINYFDLGNGLYTWLYKKGRICPGEGEWHEALRLAQDKVRENLLHQKETARQFEGFESLRTVIGKRLADVMNEDGEFIKLVRQEAFRIMLAAWLRRQAGSIEPSTRHLPTTPNLPPADPDAPKPFSHAQYIQSLKEQLPNLDDESLSNLQLKARSRNVLDVYELTSDEWNRRQANKKTTTK